MTFLRFEQINDTGKTKVFAAYNCENGSHLGYVKWHGAWRKYVLRIDDPTIWSSDCLVDAAKFIELLMEERRLLARDKRERART